MRLTTLFLLILLPLVSVSLYSNHMSQSVLTSQIGQRVQASLHSSIGYLELISNNVGQMSFLIATDKGVNEVLGRMEKDVSKEYLYELRLIQQQFAALLSVNRTVQEMMVVHAGTGNALSYESGVVHFAQVQEAPWYKEALQANGRLVLFVPDEAMLDKMTYWKRDRVYFIRVMDPYSLDMREKNVVVTSISQSVLMDIVRPLIPSGNTEMGLTYKGHTILSQPAESGAGSAKKLTFSAGTGASGWELTIRQPEGEILQSSYKIRDITNAIMVLSIVLAFIVSLFLYSGISKPLFRLTAQMKQVALGNLNAQVQHERQDELGYVMNSFNTMVSKQKQLIEDVYEKELRLAKAQFQLLQSQINPHFLYNTLDCIYTVSEEHEVQEVSEMVMNLAMFFRVSLGKGRETFTVEETLEHLMYYIRVQQIRLMDRFQVLIDVQQEAKQVPLLRLLLQPLIENAIVHGLENVTQKGHLAIRITLDAGYLRIVIQDTGMGLEPETLKQLHQELLRIDEKQKHALPQEGESVASQFFALKNVKSRLKLYYGPEANLLIDSKPSEGATVTVLVPVSEPDQPIYESEATR